jgi:predicted transposase/invertase (TIGR01784 family)
LQYSIAAMDQHIRQGHKKLPIVLPICLYHGEQSPYPHSLDFYDSFSNPDLARRVMFKPFILLDLTVIPDDKLAEDGLASLMEMLLKHARAKNFLTILKQRRECIKKILKQLGREPRRFVVKFVINEIQYDETEPDAVDQIVQIFATDLPEDKENIMTFAQQLEQRGFQKGQWVIAKNMLAKGLDSELIKEVTDLSDQDLLSLEG